MTLDVQPSQPSTNYQPAVCCWEGRQASRRQPSLCQPGRDGTASCSSFGGGKLPFAENKTHSSGVGQSMSVKHFLAFLLDTLGWLRVAAAAQCFVQPVFERLSHLSLHLVELLPTTGPPAKVGKSRGMHWPLPDCARQRNPGPHDFRRAANRVFQFGDDHGTVMVWLGTPPFRNAMFSQRVWLLRTICLKCKPATLRAHMASRRSMGTEQRSDNVFVCGPACVSCVIPCYGSMLAGSKTCWMGGQIDVRPGGL
jgi:hypothetical protein